VDAGRVLVRDEGEADRGLHDLLDWAALHPVIFNLAVVLFSEAVERHLPEPLFSPQGLARLNLAMTTLQRLGTRSTSRAL
jgi:hypothetical protein